MDERVQSLAETEGAAATSAARDIEIFGKFVLLKKLATGGMGEILLAKLKGPVGFEKLLVVKRILDHHLENAAFVEMFLDEARLAARLSHANIVQIYEMGQIDGHYYLAMEYVHGTSLRDILQRARARGEYLHPGHVVDIMAAACAGLAYAHNVRDLTGAPLGIIHRDINPQNLLVSYNGEVKVIDFGIAKAETSQAHTEIGTIKGKFVYMSPEQSAAQPLDPRSDLFAAGIVLYECLALRNPFIRGNVMQSIEAIRGEDAAPIVGVSRTLAPFEPVLAKALAKRREDRFADCTEMQHALQALVARGEIPRPPCSLAEYMQDLFEVEIAADKKLLMELDALSDQDLAEIWAFQTQEHRSGPHASTGSMRLPEVTTSTALLSRPPSGARPVVSPSVHPNRPFVWALGAVVVATIVGIAAIVGFRGQSRSMTVESRDALSETSEPAADPVVPDREDLTSAGADESADEPSMHSRRSARSVPAPRQSVVRAASLGTLLLSTVPPVKVMRDGKTLGQTVRLASSSGRLLLGGGNEAARAPFVVTLSYRVQGKDLHLELNTAPWAIVRDGNNIGLGKTPVRAVLTGDTMGFDMINPKEGRQMRLTVRYNR